MVGWYASVFVVAFVASLVTGTAKDTDASAASGGIDIVHIVFGLLFFGLAYVTWIKRPRVGAERSVAAGERADIETIVLDEEIPQKKNLLQRLDGLGVVACLGVGFLQGALILKNPPLAISAGMQIGAAGLPLAEVAAMIAAFALAASLGALLPLVIALIGGQKADKSLREAREWIEANMTAITLVVLVVVGAIFLGEGLGLTN